MLFAIPHSAALACHPETRSQAAHGIEARVSHAPGGSLAVAFILKGDLTRLRIPSPQPPRRMDRLWQHTCFEVFVSAKGASAYYEFNLAPSGEWAAYGFRGYRDGAPLKDEDSVPTIAIHSAGDRLDLEAVVRLDFLPTMPPRVALRLGLCAVIEEEDGGLSYWALKHPTGKPDFHHRDSFALELEPPV